MLRRTNRSPAPMVGRLALALTLLAVVAPAGAQQTRQLTAADYDQAVKFLAPNLAGTVVGGSVDAHWLSRDRFWYRSQTMAGYEFVVVDPQRRRSEPAFDHVALAGTLSSKTGQTYDARNLPFREIELSDDGQDVSFNVDGRRWSCDVGGRECKDVGAATETRPRQPSRRFGFGGGPTSSDGKPLTLSPDGKLGAFVRDWNLWVHDMETGTEKALTTDGVENYGYATDNAGWRHSDRAIVKWSPDSKMIATQQQDDRPLGDMYLVRTKVGHPELEAWKYPLPGDSVVSMVHRVVIDVAAGTVVRLNMPPDFHRAMLGDDISMNDYQWDPDDSQLALVSTSRYHKSATLKVADTKTGKVRTVMDETVPTQYESVTGYRVLWDTHEVVWFSERDNWGQLYLYDLNSGKLKRKITDGEGPVVSIERIDPESRTVWYGANAREPGQDPYFTHFYRIGLDAGPQVSLTPAVGTHSIQLAPDGRYLVDTYSQPDVAPVVEVHDRSGKKVMDVEKADISKLLATGWKPPIPITVKARDGKTDLYGLMFRPTNFDPDKKYPIINNAYPGPQSGSVRGRAFTPARGDKQALAELGFVVVSIDGMGTPGRSKSFHDKWYGAMGRDNTLPDQVIGMKELAQKYPWIDIDRAAMWGHSGGGFITADAMFRYPDFFKVGISESGNHDQREYEDDWGERYQGELIKSDGTDNYAAEANENLAKNLKGHLLIAHGSVDDNVPPYNTLLVVDALIKANKDFDMLLLTNQRHGYGDDSDYMMRRRWDYFVKWLLGAEPPKEYEIKTPEFRGR